MKCPGCGSALTGAPLGPAGETNQSFRCLRCGGFFVNGWLVNRLKADDLEKWPGINADQSSLAALASDECPNDTTKMDPFTGETVPPGVEVKHCAKCGWFWFPTNNLFKFKPAQEAKVAYFKLWGKAADMSALLLPVMAAVVLVFGIGLGVNLIRQQQQTEISASEAVRDVRIVSIGPGEVVVTFQSRAAQANVIYRKAGDEMGQTVPAAVGQGGWASVKISGLTAGESYRFAVEANGVKTEEMPFMVGN